MEKTYEEFINVVKKNVKSLEQKGYINNENIDTVHQKLESFILNHKDNNDSELNKLINMINLTNGNILLNYIYRGNDEAKFNGVFLGYSPAFYPYQNKFKIFDNLTENEKKLYEQKGLYKNGNLIEGDKILQRDFCIAKIFGILENGEQFTLTLFNKSATTSVVKLNNMVSFTANKQEGNNLVSNNIILNEQYKNKPLPNINELITPQDKIDESMFDNPNRVFYIDGFIVESGTTPTGMLRYGIYSKAYPELLGTIRSNSIIKSMVQKDTYYLIAITNIRKSNAENSNLINCEIAGVIPMVNKNNEINPESAIDSFVKSEIDW